MAEKQIDEKTKKAEEEAKAKAEAEEKAKKEAEEKAKAEEEAKKAEEEAKAKANGVKLKVLVAFTDKYTKADYVINDEIVVDENRAKELLADPRRLVERI